MSDIILCLIYCVLSVLCACIMLGQRKEQIVFFFFYGLEKIFESQKDRLSWRFC